jgi:cytochrome oxidase Cu insertion factor (SCO1/SenC/PrrC family)
MPTACYREGRPQLIAQVPALSRAQQTYTPTMAAGDVVPDLVLVDQAGKRVSLRDGRMPSIVSFAETDCPDRACALVTAKFGRLQRTLRGTGIRLVEVTLDPSFDRPVVLQRYAAAAGARIDDWKFATGNPADVVALAERFGILRESRTGDGVAHSDAVAIVSGSGVLEDRIDGNDWSPNDVAALARRDAGLASNPFAQVMLGALARASAICGGRGGGIPLIGALAIFATSVVVFSLLAVRLFGAALLGRS